MLQNSRDDHGVICCRLQSSEVLPGFLQAVCHFHSVIQLQRDVEGGVVTLRGVPDGEDGVVGGVQSQV